MRLLRDGKGARRASSLALVLIVCLGVTLAVLTGCSTEPSRPGGNTPRTQQPPAQLPDDFPTYGENSDSIGTQPGGDPGMPPMPGERGAMWVRFRAFNDATRPDVGLWILREGRAAAMSLAEGPPAHHAWITPDTLQIVAGWFEAAGFRDLTQTSYFTGGEPGRICEIFLRDRTGVAHRVIGDEAALPEAVRILARDLEGLATHILVSTPGGPTPPPGGDSTWVPPPPPFPVNLRGDLEVTPQIGPVGTPRTIRLTLLNESRDTVMVRFRSSQTYDFMLMNGWMEPPHPPGGDSTWVPPDSMRGGDPDDPAPPGGCPGGPPQDGRHGSGPAGGSSGWPIHGGGSAAGGMAGGHPGHGGHGGHGDPDCPPDSTWAPPDSGGCPGDSTWAPPSDSTGTWPDSTITPPDRLIWNWAHDRAFLPVESTLVLAPGGRVVYTETWDGTSNGGEIVGAGRYALSAPIFSDQPVMGGMTRIEVTPR